MAYTKTTWVDNTTPYINASNLNKIETGVDEAHDDIATNVTAIALNTAKTGVTTEISNLVEDTTPQLYADLDCQGNWLLDSASIQALAAKGPGYWFNGVNSTITIADNANLDWGNGNGAIEMLVSLLDVSSDVSLYARREDGSNQIYLYYDESNNRIDGYVQIAGVIIQRVQADWTPVAHKMYHIVWSFENGAANLLVVNGKSLTLTLNTVTGGDFDLAIALVLGEFGGVYSNITYSLCRQYNTNLTEDEMFILSNGAPVPYRHIGASQTNKVTGNDSDMSGANNWGGVNLLALDINTTVAGKLYMQLAASGSSFTRLIDKTVVGKKYKVSLKVRLRSGTGKTLSVGNSTTPSDGTFECTPTGTETTFKGEFIAENTTFLIGHVTSNSSEYEIDDVVLTQVGCNGQYEQDGIGNNQWLENSGNELHGTVSGAIPTNLPPTHREKYIDLTVTGDTSFTLPKDYLISSIVLQSDGAIGGGIDIGTTNGGGEIVTAEAIANTTPVLCALVAGANYNTTGADDTVYITDADGTGWDSATVIVRVNMERV